MLVGWWVARQGGWWVAKCNAYFIGRYVQFIINISITSIYSEDLAQDPEPYIKSKP